MRRRSFKLGFRNKTVLERLAISETFLREAAKLPLAKRPYMKLEMRQKELAAIREVNAAIAEAKILLSSRISLRNKLLKKFCEDITCDANGVCAAADNDAEVQAAGLRLSREKKPVSLPGSPAKFRAVPTDLEGAVQLRWKRLFRRCTTLIEYTTDPNGDWKVLTPCSGSKFLVTKLVPGQKYWFRITLMNTRGYGPTSSPLAVRAA